MGSLDENSPVKTGAAPNRRVGVGGGGCVNEANRHGACDLLPFDWFRIGLAGLRLQSLSV